MDDDYEPATYQRPSRKLRWQNILAVVLSGTGGVIDEVGSICEAIASLLMADGNYADDRAAFHEEAALELESLISEVDE